jgi:hypothetical protein
MSGSELEALADEILADVRQMTGDILSPREVTALRIGIITRMRLVQVAAARAWLGAAMRRGRGDD